jgi:D-alanine-D-alanine ligase
VKPTNRGDSKGIDERSVVYSKAELEAKIIAIHTECSSDALIEEYLPGREFSVAIITRPRTGDVLAMPIELTPPADKKGNSFLSEAVKQADTEKVSAVDDTDLKTTLNALALGVFKVLGSRDYGRIDMRLDARGEPHFIEANLMPGLSNHGYLSSCFRINEDIGYEDMILLIVSAGFERAARTPIEAASVLLDGSPVEVAADPLVGTGLVV